MAKISKEIESYEPLNPLGLSVNLGALVYAVVPKKIGKAYLIDIVKAKVYAIKTTNGITEKDIMLECRGQRSDMSFYRSCYKYGSINQKGIFTSKEAAEEYADTLYTKLNSKMQKAKWATKKK